MRRRDFLVATGTVLASGGWNGTTVRSAQLADKPAPASKTLDAPALCVAPDIRAANAGAEMLRLGGNAFDAMVAAGFMEAVIAPQSCGIGGYGATGIGFHARSGKVVAIDANAVAPRAAVPDMFPVLAGADGKPYRLPNSKHKRGPLSVAVPGVLAGLLSVLTTWGSLDRKTVMGPAIRQARNGIPLAAANAQAWLKMKAEAEGTPAPRSEELGKLVPMAELADTMEAIADEGPDIFYSGRIGKAIADHIQKLGGILTRDDQAAYRPIHVEPISVEVRGHSLLTPPPGAGGLTSLQIAALFDRLHRPDKQPSAGSAAAYEALIEIHKVVWEERLTQLGDPSAMTNAPQALLAEAHLGELLNRVIKGLEHPSPGRIIAPDPLSGTVHLAAADAAGNVVAWTQTHGGGFGSGVMVPKTGIVLGHGMCRFEPRPGWVNSVAPGKLPLHNMSPVLALKNGRPVLAVGAAGGRSIVNNSATLTINHLILGESPSQAMSLPRVQCETMEPAVIEATAGAECLSTLRARGHFLKEAKRDAGTAHLIARAGDSWIGVAESRAPTAGVAAAVSR